MRCLLCSVVVLAACTPREDKASEVAAKAEGKTEVKAEVKAEAEVIEAKVEPEPEPQPKPVEDAPAETETPKTSPDPPGMHRVIEGEELHLHPMADGGLVVSVGPQLYIVGKGGTLTEDPALLAGLPAPFDREKDGTAMRWGWKVDVSGRWPDAAFLSYHVAPAPRVDAPPRVTFRWKQDRWERTDLGARFDEGGMSWFYEEGRPWIEGSVLSLRRHQISYGDAAFVSEWESVEPARARRHERQTKAATKEIAGSKQLVVTRGLPKGPDLAAMMTKTPPPLRTFDSLPTGEIYAATAEEQGMLLAVLEGRVLEHPVPLPPAAASVDLRDVFAVSPEHVLVVGGYRHYDELRPLVAQWDGKALRLLEAPKCAQHYLVGDVVELPDGTQVVRCSIFYEEDGFESDPPEMFWRTKDGPWTRANVQSRELAVFEGALWIAATDGVYTTASTPPASLKAPTTESLDDKLLADGPKPLGLQRRLY